MTKKILPLFILSILQQSAIAHADEAMYIIQGVITSVNEPDQLILTTPSGKNFLVGLSWVAVPKRISLIPNSNKSQQQGSNYGNKFGNRYANQYESSNYRSVYQSTTKEEDDSNYIKQPGYDVVRDFMRASLGHSVDCEVTTKNETDSIKCDLIDHDRNDYWYNAELILSGLGMIIDSGAPEQLRMMEESAKKKGTGLWKDGFPNPLEWELRTRTERNIK